MPYRNADALVSTDWLEANLASPNLTIADASWWLPVSQRNALEEYTEGHVPGAVFFDIDDISDHSTDVPHMLPKPDAFAAKVGALGMGNGQRIVVYDNAGGAAAAARVWWMFRVYGHRNIAVLDGGFPKWLRERRRVDDRIPTPTPRVFTPRRHPDLYRSLDEVKTAVDSHAEQIIDARTPGRFAGIEPEPRPVPRLGHIPGSVNVPFLSLLDKREMTVLPAEAIAQSFIEAGVDLSRPVVTTCGSGVTCCMLSLGLYLIGKTDVASYDGSWAEWSHHADLPVERA